MAIKFHHNSSTSPNSCLFSFIATINHSLFGFIIVTGRSSSTAPAISQQEAFNCVASAQHHVVTQINHQKAPISEHISFFHVVGFISAHRVVKFLIQTLATATSSSLAEPSTQQQQQHVWSATVRCVVESFDQSCLASWKLLNSKLASREPAHEIGHHYRISANFWAENDDATAAAAASSSSMSRVPTVVTSRTLWQ